MILPADMRASHLPFDRAYPRIEFGLMLLATSAFKLHSKIGIFSGA
jgi:hypothetical protein